MMLSEATILVVDDEPELLEIFSVWLRRYGATVLNAANGAEALNILSSQPIQCLISDIRMPIMDGMTLVRKIYDLRIVVPSIIFVSGFGDIDIREMYALGVEAMLAKPLSRQQLLDAIEASLKDRTELWTTPPVTPAGQSIALTFESLDSALAARTFGIGRGGCCLHLDRQLRLDEPIQLSIRFSRENLLLEASGIVRWHHLQHRCAGIEFTYIPASCREWVIAAMHEEARRSFIPAC